MRWFRRSQRDFEEEIAAHLELEQDRLVAEGMRRDDALFAARRRFGNVGVAQDRYHDAGRLRWLSDLLSDVRFAVRLARHRPGFSANVVLISALGIASCVTTFSLVSGILLTPLPFSEPDRVFSLALQAPSFISAAVPVTSYLQLAEGSPVIDAIAAAQPARVLVDADDAPTRLRSERVTASFFRVFGVRPILGRTFAADEVNEGAPVAMLGYTRWRTRFAGDSSVIGTRIDLDGSPHTIIGVMPPRFQAFAFEEPAFWLPLRLDRSDPARIVNPVLRVASGVSRERAEAWLAGIVRLRVRSYAARDSVAAVPVLVPAAESIYGDVERPLLVLLGAVLLVLALVAANVATMFLARAAAREDEFAVRGALGASAGRQIRQLLTESLALTVTGGVIGVALSAVAVRWIRVLGATVLPRMEEVSIDWRVVAFAIVAVVATGLSGGIAHAVSTRKRQAARFSTASRGGGGGRATRQATSSTLVAAQIALSVVLLVGAGLLVKGFLRVAPTHPGFAIENRAMVKIDLPSDAGGEPMTPGMTRRFVDDIAAAMQTVPGVRDVATTTFAPMTGSTYGPEIEPIGRPAGDERFRATMNKISTNFFDVMEMPILSGRQFTTSDRDGAELVAVINETAAARWWPDANAIGRRVAYGRSPDRRIVTVVGVVRDGRVYSSTTSRPPQIFVPAAQDVLHVATFMVATSVDPRSTVAGLRDALWSVAPGVPIEASGDLENMALRFLRRPKFFSVVMSLFATSAIVLSALGVYGLLSYAVARRNREIGIRIALGASSARIGKLVVVRVLCIMLVGIGTGLMLARALTGYMGHLLTEVSATDPTIFGASTMAVFVVACLAACAPTWRAMRVDPVGIIKE